MEGRKSVNTTKGKLKNVSWMMGESLVFHADKFLKDEQEINLAGFHIRVLHTPGHTKGGCCYYFPYENVVFCGDTLSRFVSLLSVSLRPAVELQRPDGGDNHRRVRPKPRHAALDIQKFLRAQFRNHTTISAMHLL